MVEGWRLWGRDILENLKNEKTEAGRRFLMYDNAEENLYEAFEKTSHRYPLKMALTDEYGHSLTYTELREMAEQFSEWIWTEKNVRQGTRVGILMYNSIEFCVAFLALIRIGASTVPLPGKFSGQEISVLAEKAHLKTIVCDEKFRHYFSEEKDLILSRDAEHGYGFRYLGIGKRPYRIRKGDRDREVLYMFTSGTTSRSKGVIICNYSMMHAIEVYKRILHVTDRDKTVIATPVYHITGTVALLGLFLRVGGSIFLHRTFQACRVLDTIKKESLTFLHASPSVYFMLLEKREQYGELPSVRAMVCGSSHMPEEKIRQMHEWLPGMCFHTVYGLTETTSPAAVFPGDAGTSPYIGASGRPVPGTEFCIAGEDGRECPSGSVGEIRIRGTVLLKGYDNGDGSFENGWLSTGDMGFFNEQGYLYVVDRKKDMINRGGEKIWSFDLENELLKIEGVKDASVVAVPDAVYGEVPAALIVSERAVKVNEIREILRERVAKYKIPEKIFQVGSIPQTPNGKVDKKKIKQWIGEMSE